MDKNKFEQFKINLNTQDKIVKELETDLLKEKNKLLAYKIIEFIFENKEDIIFLTLDIKEFYSSEIGKEIKYLKTLLLEYNISVSTKIYTNINKVVFIAKAKNEETE